MIVCIRCVQSGKNYFKTPNLLGYYLQTCAKTTDAGDEKKVPNDNDTSSTSSSSSESDEPKISENKNDKIQKLNELLMNLAQQDKVIKKSGIDLAQPPNRRKQEKPKEETNEIQNEEQKIVKAVRDVANEIGGDSVSTESELLKKLLSSKGTSTPRNITDIIKDMKIDREKTFSDKSRADQVRSILQRKEFKSRVTSESRTKTRTIPFSARKTEQVTSKIDLFGGDALGIFTNADKLEVNTQTKTWEKLQNRDLRLAVTHPPSNYFQQMILWTEEGKVWKFPIDNEQGLDEEKKVHFSQHVFMEELLEPWCPQKGPIRHFMELVCVGLSKNPYLTVQAKQDHIEWYKNYFDSKKALLQEVGAIQG